MSPTLTFVPLSLVRAAQIKPQYLKPNSLRTTFFHPYSPTCSKTYKIGFRTGFEPISPSIPAREESVFVHPLIPRPWKHQSSHPLDQILSDINTGVQTRSKLKKLCAFYAFLSNKNFLETMLKKA